MEKEIERCLEILKAGGTLLYPTDTIWGIGCDATNQAAVEKIFRLKQRTESKSMIILLDSVEKLAEYVSNIPLIARDLLMNVDKPLTIIYPEGKNLAANLIADDGSIAIRIVKNEFCSKLIAAFDKPIVSTSANISGDAPPASFHNIVEEIKLGVDYVVNDDFEEIHEQKPSRIIRLMQNGEFLIIRE